MDLGVIGGKIPGLFPPYTPHPTPYTLPPGKTFSANPM